MIIYKTTNLVNGKMYIGQDKNNNKFYLGAGKLLTKAIKKYGKKNFIKEILHSCTSLEELNKLELFYIELYNAVESDKYYNLAPGGHPLQAFKGRKPGYTMSEKTKKKISQAHIGLTPSKETRLKQALAKKGKSSPMKEKKHTPETLNRIAFSRLKYKGKILECDLKGNVIKEWSSLIEVKGKYLDLLNIYRNLRGQRKSAYKKIWKYKD